MLQAGINKPTNTTEFENIDADFSMVHMSVFEGRPTSTSPSTASRSGSHFGVHGATQGDECTAASIDPVVALQHDLLAIQRRALDIGLLISLDPKEAGLGFPLNTAFLSNYCAKCRAVGRWGLGWREEVDAPIETRLIACFKCGLACQHVGCIEPEKLAQLAEREGEDSWPEGYGWMCDACDPASPAPGDPEQFAQGVFTP